MDENIINLKKQIVYRCSHTGTKETDILFNKLIINKIDKLNIYDLINLSNLFKDFSDMEILLILKKKKLPNLKYKKLFIKLIR